VSTASRAGLRDRCQECDQRFYAKIESCRLLCEKGIDSKLTKSHDSAVHLNSDDMLAANERCTQMNSEQEALEKVAKNTEIQLWLRM
jgi:hypothetical protein